MRISCSISRQKFGSIEKILTKLQQPKRFLFLLCPACKGRDMKLAYFVTFLVAILNSNLRSISWVHSTSISVQKSNLLQACCLKERRQLPNLHDRVARSIRFNRRPSNELDKLINIVSNNCCIYPNTFMAFPF